MQIKLTKRERATVLAALRRWLSYPAAREADSIATNGWKHKPLDNAEIDRLCKRITELETKPDMAPLHRQSKNGAREPKVQNCQITYARLRKAINSDRVTQKISTHFRYTCSW